ncbi:urea ABC transporter permease subunit UrtB [Pseudaeromonas sharmana]
MQKIAIRSAIRERSGGLGVSLRMVQRCAIAVLAMLLCLSGTQAAAMSVEQAEQVLTGKSFDDKAQALTVLSGSGATYVSALFSALDEGDLYYRKQDGRLVIKGAAGFTALHDGRAVPGKAREFKRVAVNNALREQLSQLTANLALGDADPARRLAAVEAMFGKVTPAQTTALQARLQQETDSRVKESLQAALAMGDLQSPEAQRRLSAVLTLAAVKHPLVIEALRTAAEQDSDVAVKRAARDGLRALTRSQQFYAGVETLYFGLSLGSVLVLAGIGLAITFGVMGVINMAHGELMMLGAYTTFVLQQWLPGQPALALLLSIPAAFVVSGLVGIVIERGVIRFLYGRPLETLLATFGISLLLQQAVRTIFSPLNQSVVMPSFMSGTLTINGFLALTQNRLCIILFCLLVFSGLMWLLKRSRLGLEVRAVSQNRAMARNMGVRSARVNALTFGLGSGIAGIAGVALSQLTNVGPNLGQNYIVDAFMVVVFGGVGNLWGTLVAGLTLGVANKLLEPLAGAMLAKIVILVAIILFIQKRPRGLFPQRGRAVEG